MPSPFPDTVPSGYPSFAPLFEGSINLSISTVVPYLNLLWLPKNSYEAVLTTARTVKQAIAHSPNVEAEVIAMFDGSYWRTHLVAASAVAWGVDSCAVLLALWQAFDRGTFVSPQLAAVAFLRDPTFEVQARAHIVHGYANYSNKSLAALVGVCKLLSPPLWLEDALQDEARHQAITDKWDKADDLATSWLRDIQTVQADSVQ